MSKFNQNKVMLRYSVIAILMTIVAIAVLGKALYLMTAKRDYWQQVANRVKKDSVSVKPIRGNILSCDGQLMASSLPEFKLFMDFKALEEAKNDSLFRCKLDTVERLIDFFNNDIYPIVYMQGSLGASGDLVPLAHLSLPLVGLGEVEFEGEVMTGAAVLEKKGWKPIHLASKEGLALLNGTQNMSSFAVWGLLQAIKLSDWADKIAVMSLDAYEGLPNRA